MAEWVRFQKFVARQMSKCGLKAWTNGQAHGGFGVPDVDAHPFAIECKSYEKMTSKLIVEAIRQAQLDTSKCDKYPIAIVKDAQGDIVVAMDFKDFKNLVIEFIAKKEGGE